MSQSTDPLDLFERFAETLPLHLLPPQQMLDRILIARSERASRMVAKAHLRATSEQRATKPRAPGKARTLKVADPLAEAQKQLAKLPPAMREAFLLMLKNKGV